jgi:predicted regulator of Ras-like GTPase activity (Roadblock/LC7/MglB family)
VNFRAVLEEFRSAVDGTLAVTLIGTDGIPIDTITSPDLPMESISAELTSFLKGLRLSNTELDTGDVRQISVVTDRYTTILSQVTSDYFLLVILSPDASYGRARFELAKAKFKLQDELS